MNYSQSGEQIIVDGLDLVQAASKLPQGKLNEGEMMYFVNNLRNRAVYLKGNIFANDQHSDEQLQMEIAINSKYDGLNSTRDI